jgi:predicted  nucleic acid-binding Zn-ribbon protein
MTWFDDILNFGDKASNFLDKGSRWLKPIGNLISSQSNISRDAGLQDDLIRYMEAEQARANADVDAYNQAYGNYLDQYDAYRANANAVAQANANARAAAQRATEANRLRAAKKGFKKGRREYKDAIGKLDPYVEAGKKITPAQVENYLTFLNNVNTLTEAQLSPASQARLTPGPTDITTFDIPLPEHMRKK